LVHLDGMASRFICGLWGYPLRLDFPCWSMSEKWAKEVIDSFF
jgi:hypothetical protein